MNADESQKLIIDARDGFVLADAGPGTGKTHTVTNRCMSILKDSLNQPDHRMAMLTFTHNAADEMKERIISEASAMHSVWMENPDSNPDDMLDDDQYRNISVRIRKSYIGTFDSFCLDIVKKDPASISSFFGFRNYLSSSSSISANDTVNKMIFRRFVNTWVEDNGSDPKYAEYPAIAVKNPDSLFHLVGRLMSMGVIPLKNGAWWAPDESGGQDGGMKILEGDPDVVFEELKKFTMTKEAKKKLENMEKCWDSMFADGVSPESFDEDAFRLAAYEDRSALFAMVHDIYRGYMEYSVSTDHLTFSTVACFAYVVLYTSPDLREKIAFDHMVVDEFQDTNTLQLMICMMSLRKPNLCAVGDWRQGIYGFRYVSIENIRNFHSRLVSIRNFLNDDGIDRVPFDIPPKSEIRELPLDRSYRSSQNIIHASYAALNIPDGCDDPVESVSERFDGEIISVNDPILAEYTSVVKVPCSDKKSEIDETVRRVVSFVSEMTPILDKATREFRPARFGDISVLCRTSAGCREIYDSMREHGVPVFLQGDLEIMNTCEGKLLLAWLRFVENQNDSRGYVPILGYLGYSASEILGFEGNLPTEIMRIRRDLFRRSRRLSSFASAVFQYHGVSNDTTQAIISVLSSTHRDSLMTLSDMINIIEADIKDNTRYSVDGCPESDAVVVQTIHKSKGLEYPIVVIPFIDSMRFPSTNSRAEVFEYTPEGGVRCSMIRVDIRNGESILGRSWKSRLVNIVRKKDNDEERRLFFVAISRAKQHVVFCGTQTSKDNKKTSGSPFFKGIPADVSEPGSGPVPNLSESDIVARPDPPDVSYNRYSRPKAFSVHDIMGNGDTDTVGTFSKGKGMQYGNRVHAIAEMMVHGSAVDARTREEIPECDVISRFLGTLADGERFTEVPCHYHTEVGGRKVALAGSIDFLLVGRDSVHVYDWKTDADRRFAEDYRIQLSVYLRCVERAYPGRSVDASIVWLSVDGGIVDPISPLSDTEISEIIEEAQLQPVSDSSFNSDSDINHHPGVSNSQ